MILTTDKRLGVKAGEVYEARRYQYDPHEKYSLIARIPDGYDPSCNQYIDCVATKVRGVWCRVVNGAFEEIPANELPAVETKKSALENLSDFITEDILAMSDDEVESELQSLGVDVDKQVSKFRNLLSKKVKVTPAQQLTLNTMVKLNREATIYEIGAKRRTMLALKRLGLVGSVYIPDNDERFRGFGHTHWYLVEGFDLNNVEVSDA
jgi:hypothetical protein